MSATADLHRRAVKVLGSSKVHMADLPAGTFGLYRMSGAPFLGVEAPVAASCGAVLRCRTGVLVCMHPGEKVTCRPCSRITNVVESGPDNGKSPDGSIDIDAIIDARSAS